MLLKIVRAIIICFALLSCNGIAQADSLNMRMVGSYSRTIWDGFDSVGVGLFDFSFYENYLYLGTTEFFYIIDISDPANLVELAGGAYRTDFASITNDSSLYVITGRVGDMDVGGIKKYDITDMQFPTSVASVAGGAIAMQLAKPYLYALGRYDTPLPKTAFKVIDYNSFVILDSVVLGSTISKIPRSFAIVDSFVFVSTSKYGVLLLEIERPDSVVGRDYSLTDTFECFDVVPGPNKWPWVSACVVGSGSKGVTFWATALDSAKRAGVYFTYDTPGSARSVAIDGGGWLPDLYIADSNSVRFVDFYNDSLPPTVREEGYYIIPSSSGHRQFAKRVKLHNGYIYAITDSTLYIFQRLTLSGVTGGQPVANARKSQSLSIRGNKIVYYLSKDFDVSLSLYNLVGQQVRSWRSKSARAGEHSVEVRGLASGIYLARLEAGGRPLLGKLVYVK